MTQRLSTPTRTLLIAVCFSVVGIILVVIGGIVMAPKAFPAWIGLIFLVFWLAYFITLMILAATSLIHGVAQREHPQLAKNIFCLYVSHTLCFATGYILCSLLGDFNHLVSEYTHYELYSTPFVADNHALKGLEYSLWAPPDDFRIARYSDSSQPDVDWLCAIVKKTKFEDFVRFDLPSVAPAFLEHYYFSTVTITTLGYGDILPNGLVTKLIVTAQVLSGIVLVTFILGAPKKTTGSAETNGNSI